MLYTPKSFTEAKEFIRNNSRYCIIVNLSEMYLEEVQLKSLSEAFQSNFIVNNIYWHPEQEISNYYIEKIEDQIQENLSFYRDFPTDYIYFLLALASNGNIEESDQVKVKIGEKEIIESLNNWKVHRIFQNYSSIGYQAVLYGNDKTKQMVLSHAFLESEVNMVVDSGVLSERPFHNILQSIILFVGNKEVSAVTEEAGKIAGSEYKLSTTGYFIGGHFAQFSSHHAEKSSSQIKKTVVFESPCSRSLEHVKITNYISFPSILNNCKKNSAGEVFSVYGYNDTNIDEYINFIQNINTNEDFNQKELFKFFKALPQAMFEQFNSTTGTFQNLYDIKNIPIVKYSTPSSLFRLVETFSDHAKDIIDIIAELGSTTVKAWEIINDENINSYIFGKKEKKIEDPIFNGLLDLIADIHYRRIPQKILEKLLHKLEETFKCDDVADPNYIKNQVIDSINIIRERSAFSNESKIVQVTYSPSQWEKGNFIIQRDVIESPLLTTEINPLSAKINLGDSYKSLCILAIVDFPEELQFLNVTPIVRNQLQKITEDCSIYKQGSDFKNFEVSCKTIHANDAIKLVERCIDISAGNGDQIYSILKLYAQDIFDNYNLDFDAQRMVDTFMHDNREINLIKNVIGNYKHNDFREFPRGKDTPTYFQQAKGIFQNLRKDNKLAVILIQGDSGTGKTAFTEFYSEKSLGSSNRYLKVRPDNFNSDLKNLLYNLGISCIGYHSLDNLLKKATLVKNQYGIIIFEDVDEQVAPAVKTFLSNLPRGFIADIFIIIDSKILPQSSQYNNTVAELQQYNDVIEMRPFSYDESEEYIKATSSREFSTEDVDKIFENTKGNPRKLKNFMQCLQDYKNTIKRCEKVLSDELKFILDKLIELPRMKEVLNKLSLFDAKTCIINDIYSNNDNENTDFERISELQEKAIVTATTPDCIGVQISESKQRELQDYLSTTEGAQDFSVIDTIQTELIDAFLTYLKTKKQSKNLRHASDIYNHIDSFLAKSYFNTIPETLDSLFGFLHNLRDIVIPLDKLISYQSSFERIYLLEKQRVYIDKREDDILAKIKNFGKWALGYSYKEELEVRHNKIYEYINANFLETISRRINNEEKRQEYSKRAQELSEEISLGEQELFNKVLKNFGGEDEALFYQFISGNINKYGSESCLNCSGFSLLYAFKSLSIIETLDNNISLLAGSYSQLGESYFKLEEDSCSINEIKWKLSHLYSTEYFKRARICEKIKEELSVDSNLANDNSFLLTEIPTDIDSFSTPDNLSVADSISIIIAFIPFIEDFYTAFKNDNYAYLEDPFIEEFLKSNNIETNQTNKDFFKFKFVEAISIATMNIEEKDCTLIRNLYKHDEQLIDDILARHSGYLIDNYIVKTCIRNAGDVFDQPHNEFS